MATTTTPKLPLADIHTLTLDRNSSVSLTIQLIDQLRQGIRAGRFGPGLRLPGTRRLAQTLQVARNTVTSAYEALADEGFLETRHRSGFYVSAVPPDVYLQAMCVPQRDLNEEHLPPLSRRGLALAGEPLVTNYPDPVPFHSGIPDLDIFPLETWSRLIAKSWQHATRRHLGYSHPGGLPKLKEAIAQYVSSCRGVVCRPEQIVITSGAQQALDLLVRVIADQGDIAWVEDPGYRGAKRALLSNSVRVLPLPVDAQGAVLEAGPKTLPKLVYLTPAHQYPLGGTLPPERRHQLIAWAKKNQVWLLEDDYDGEYRYDGRPLPALQGLDPDGNVVYIGAFSKVALPALRLGYAVLPHKLVTAVTAAKAMADSHSPAPLQLAVAQFIREGHFEAHVRRVRPIYAKRCALVRRLLEPLRPKFDILGQQAGMHLTLVSRKPFDDRAFCLRAQAHNIYCAPLSQYALADSRQGLILGYAAFSVQRLEKALVTLIQLLKDDPNF